MRRWTWTAIISPSPHALTASSEVSPAFGWIMKCHRVRIRYLLLFAFWAVFFLAFLATKTPVFQRKNERRSWQSERLINAGQDKHANSADIRFDVNANDVIVFLHIQKTGGSTFGQHLVLHLSSKTPCSCKKIVGKLRCSCKRPGSDESWLFSRYSSRWPCGIHAGWTQLQPCVPRVLDEKEGKNLRRKFFYITILRNPVVRFLSEYHHRRHGADWSGEPAMCDGRRTIDDKVSANLAPCGQDWMSISLGNFTECEWNPAKNRQTRMLADLTLADCDNITGMASHEREKIMLESAKENLKSMAFFGLTEYQGENKVLFEKTFGLSFEAGSFEQKESSHAEQMAAPLDEQMLRRIREANALDVQLYEYASEIFWRRLRTNTQIWSVWSTSGACATWSNWFPLYNNRSSSDT